MNRPTLFYPPPKLITPIDDNSYLASTTFSHTVTTNDNEKTLVCLEKPATTEDKRENRAFITKVYESENDDDDAEEEEEEYDNDDTEDDTYLTSLKSVESSLYYFPVTNVSYTMNPSPTNYYAQPRNTHDQGTPANVIQYIDNESYSDQRPISNNGDRTNTGSRQNQTVVPTKFQDEGYSSQNDHRSRFDTSNREQSNRQGTRSLTPEKYRLLKRRLARLQQREQSYEKNKHQNSSSQITNGHRYDPYNQSQSIAGGHDKSNRDSRHDPNVPTRDDPKPSQGSGSAGAQNQTPPGTPPPKIYNKIPPNQQPDSSVTRDPYDGQSRPPPARDPYDGQSRPPPARDPYDGQTRPPPARDPYDGQTRPPPARDPYDGQSRPPPARDPYDGQSRPPPARDPYDGQTRPPPARDPYDGQTRPPPARDPYDGQTRPPPARDPYDGQSRPPPARDPYDGQSRPTTDRPQPHNNNLDDNYRHQLTKEYKIVSGTLVLQEIQSNSQQGSASNNSASYSIQGSTVRPSDNRPPDDQKYSGNSSAHGGQSRPQSYVDNRPGNDSTQPNNNDNQENNQPNRYSTGGKPVRPQSPPLPPPQPQVPNRYFFGPRRLSRGFSDGNLNNCIVSGHGSLPQSSNDNSQSNPRFQTQTDVGTSTSPQVSYANQPGQSSRNQPIEDENQYAQLDQYSTVGSSPSQPPTLRKNPNQNGYNNNNDQYV